VDHNGNFAYDVRNVERVQRQSTIEDLLRQIEYRVFRIMKAPSGTLCGLQPIEAIGIHGDLQLCDYVLCHAEDVERLKGAVPFVEGRRRNPKPPNLAARKLRYPSDLTDDEWSPKIVIS
jgi:hypothetical protein